MMLWTMKNINKFLHILYGEGLWMTPSTARAVVKHGFDAADSWEKNVIESSCMNPIL